MIKSKTRDTVVGEAVAAMHSRISEPLRLDDFARAAGYSPFHFDRVFRAETGLSAVAFQSALRIQAAKELLLDTDQSVTQICTQLGYESIGSFTSRFTRSVGVSPTGFRAFAERLSNSDVKASLAEAFRAPQGDGPLRGTVHGCQDADAFVWIGLFHKGMPEQRPVAGALRRGDGMFSVRPVPDATYHVLAASVAPNAAWRAYLICGKHVRVATSGVVAVRGGAFEWPPALALREPQPTDPPVLASLALLAFG